MDYPNPDYTYLNNAEYQSNLEYYQHHQIDPKASELYPEQNNYYYESQNNYKAPED